MLADSIHEERAEVERNARMLHDQRSIRASNIAKERLHSLHHAWQCSSTALCLSLNRSAALAVARENGRADVRVL